MLQIDVIFISIKDTDQMTFTLSGDLTWPTGSDYDAWLPNLRLQVLVSPGSP